MNPSINPLKTAPDPQLAEIKSSIDSANAKLDIMNAHLADIAGKISDISCCCGGGNRPIIRRNNAAYVQYNGGQNADGSYQLVSYYAPPLASQAEADSINTIICLGGNQSISYDLLQSPFTLDGFSMPGVFPVNIILMDSFPFTMIKDKAGTKWIPVTLPGIGAGDYDALVSPSDIGEVPRSLCSQLYKHNCIGRSFHALIDPNDPNWTDDLKNQSAVFYLYNLPFYDDFPESSEPYYGFSVVRETGANVLSAMTWGDIIDMCGYKIFYVKMFEIDNEPYGKIFLLQQ